MRKKFHKVIYKGSVDPPICFVKKNGLYVKIDFSDEILSDVEKSGNYNVLIVALLGFTFGFDVKE